MKNIWVLLLLLVMPTTGNAATAGGGSGAAPGGNDGGGGSGWQEARAASAALKKRQLGADAPGGSGAGAEAEIDEDEKVVDVASQEAELATFITTTKNNLQCPWCKQSWSKPKCKLGDVRRHLLTHDAEILKEYPASKKYFSSCLFCNLTVPRLNSLTKHYETNHGELHICLGCKIDFKTQPNLIGHLHEPSACKDYYLKEINKPKSHGNAKRINLSLAAPAPNIAANKDLPPDGEDDHDFTIWRQPEPGHGLEAPAATEAEGDEAEAEPFVQKESLLLAGKKAASTPYKCKKCPFTITTEMANNRVQISRHKKHHKPHSSGNWNYLCDVCGYGTTKVEGITNHNRLHVLSSDDAIKIDDDDLAAELTLKVTEQQAAVLISQAQANNFCRYCKKHISSNSTTTRYQAHKHLLKHTQFLKDFPGLNKRVPKCLFCTYDNPEHYMIQRHYEANHDDTKCLACGQQLINQPELINHIHTSTDCKSYYLEYRLTNKFNSRTNRQKTAWKEPRTKVALPEINIFHAPESTEEEEEAPDADKPDDSMQEDSDTNDDDGEGPAGQAIEETENLFDTLDDALAGTGNGEPGGSDMPALGLLLKTIEQRPEGTDAATMPAKQIVCPDCFNTFADEKSWLEHITTDLCFLIASGGGNGANPKGLGQSVGQQDSRSIPNTTKFAAKPQCPICNKKYTPSPEVPFDIEMCKKCYNNQLEIQKQLESHEHQSRASGLRVRRCQSGDSSQAATAAANPHYDPATGGGSSLYNPDRAQAAGARGSGTTATSVVASTTQDPTSAAVTGIVCYGCPANFPHFPTQDALQAHLGAVLEEHYNKHLATVEAQQNVALEQYLKDNPFACTKCAYLTSKKKLLRQHITTFHPPMPDSDAREDEADGQGEEWAQEEDDEDDEDEAQTKRPSRILLCKYKGCGFIATQKGHLNTHHKNHNPEYNAAYEWPCLICSFKAESRTGLGRHVKRQHPKNVSLFAKPFQCSFPECGYIAKTNKDIQAHERIHTDERPFSCRFCSYTGRQQNHVTKHERSCREKPTNTTV